MLILRISFFLLFCELCFAQKVLKKSKCQFETPVFSDVYTAAGTLYIPYAEISEPFYAWYDGKNDRSRIDYYGDMVKTYQLAHDMSNFGTSIKIAPITTENDLNQVTCLQVNGTDTNNIKSQTILPDTTGMKCQGADMINGVSREKWRLVETIGEKKNIYTLWISYKKSPSVPGTKIAIPVKYEMKGFNTLLGSHYDHYYLEYDEFSPEAPSDDVFQVERNMSCVSFPGPGDQHIYTFNPMQEFIHNHHHHMDSAFERFKSDYKKSYEDEMEHIQRKNNFRQNLRFIHSMNRANLSFQLAVNRFADHSDAEMKRMRGKQFTKHGHNGGMLFDHNVEEEKKDLPDNFDWRLRGAVTPVKDQSVCGSCWSFGTTGAVEGAYFMKHKKLVRLSQQALIDCSWGFGNNGCDGGEDFRAYQWIMKHGGLPTEEEYGGYLGQDGYCHINNVTKVAQLTGFVNVKTHDVDAMKIALLKHGPISVAIDASHKTFSFYSNGVYYEPNCGNSEESLDHAVLAVGYGTIDGKDYWLVKNSWSNYWGNDGYILMAQKNNNCGVLTAPTYAVAA